MTEETLKEQINVVVDARERATEAKADRVASYNKWAEENDALILNEKSMKCDQDLAEIKLREMTLVAFLQTGEKTPEVGVGIRVKPILSYDSHKAMDWAVKHELALKLDVSNFEKIAKTSNLPFVTITDDVTATIATELKKV